MTGNNDSAQLSAIPTVAELMGISKVSENNVPITILRVGNDSDFIKMAKNSAPKLAGVMWSENCITLVAQNRFVIGCYEPALTPVAKMFFSREHKRSDRDNTRIWEGEFEPVLFSKQNLIKFLKTVEMVNAPKEIIDAIRNMKVTEKKEIASTINLNETSEKTVIEETEETNLPTRFSLIIPVSDDFAGKFDFEAKVVPARDRYDNEEKNKKAIELRIINARQVLRARMESIVAQIPAEVPRYYGRMDVRVGSGEWA